MRYAQVSLRILHLNDRLSARGGADWHLLTVIEAQRGEHEVMLATGFDDGTVPAPCPWRQVRALSEREHRPCAELDQITEAFEPEVIHVHNVMNPAVLQCGEALREQPAGQIRR